IILQKEGITSEEAADVARMAEGNVLKAMDLAGEGGELKEFSAIYVKLMRLAYSRNAAALRMLADSIAAMGREKCGRFLIYAGRLTRESFIFNLRNPALNAMTREETDFNARFSPFINHSNVERIMSEIRDAHCDILRNGNAKLILFDFMLKLMLLLRK
ncbi:MAG: DNA polymerase III subunit delta, partial [Muribaculaceae bacterium]|nr:DNA polymerase III subunit delta [Muribaculaceae bacterium]